MQPFPTYNTNSNEANTGGRSSSFLVAQATDVPNGDPWREKVKCPLPPRHPKWTTPDQKYSRFSLALDLAIEYELQHGRKLNPNLDTKAVRRTISNRLSAQRSRMKRSLYIVELERRIKELEVIIAGLIPKVEIYREKKRLVQQENDSLRTMLEIRATESIKAENQLEERRREILSLKRGLSSPAPAAEESNPKPYSLEFSEQGLMRMEMNQMNVGDTVSSPPAVSDQDSMIELLFDDDEEEEVDQYLNLEE